MQLRLLFVLTFGVILFGSLDRQRSLAAELAAGPLPMHTGVAIEGISDLALDAYSQANGRVVTAAGFPLAGATLVLHRDGRELARTITNESGNFTITGLQGGLYQMTAAAPSGNTTGGVFRFWSYGAAPPSAQHQVQFVTSDVVVRGQNDQLGPLQRVTTNPWLSAAAITALVATPIALSNDGS